MIRIEDPEQQMEVAIAPDMGNIATSFRVRGKEILWMPPDWAPPALGGIPFLAPWANRLDQDAFYANGRKYLLNGALNNLRRDSKGHPIHGLLLFSPQWKVIAHERGEATSRLEFWRYPDLMAQFPFAHSLEMTYRLEGGALEVRTRVENQSAESMPIAVGYHPYLRLGDSPRDSWRVYVPAREHVRLSADTLPAGERDPVTFPNPVELAAHPLDDVFANLVRDQNGRAEFWVQGVKERIAVQYGPKYTIGIVYAPPGRDFICIEPMSAITNAFNLAQEGSYKELQTLSPNDTWEESYWIRPAGF